MGLCPDTPSGLSCGCRSMACQGRVDYSWTARIFLTGTMDREYLNKETTTAAANSILPPMQYLYAEKEISEIAAIISLLAQAIALKDFSTIDSENKKQLEALEDFDSIGASIELLARFTMRVNPNFSEKDFQKLRDVSMDCYRSNYRRRMESFWKGLHNWQRLFEGCRFFQPHISQQ